MFRSAGTSTNDVEDRRAALSKLGTENEFENLLGHLITRRPEQELQCLGIESDATFARMKSGGFGAQTGQSMDGETEDLSEKIVPFRRSISPGVKVGMSCRKVLALVNFDDAFA
jgi:hypothetical protein